MNRLIFSSIMILSGLLVACSTPVDLNAPREASSGSSGSLFFHSEYRCDADPAQKLVGKTFSDSIEREARSLSGSRHVRTLRPGQVITMEYDPERLNLRLDSGDVITTIGCG